MIEQIVAPSVIEWAKPHFKRKHSTRCALHRIFIDVNLDAGIIGESLVEGVRDGTAVSQAGKEQPMKVPLRVLCMIIASAALVANSGCSGEGPGTAEKAGKKIDEAVEAAGEAMNEGAEEVGSAAGKALGKAEKAVDQLEARMEKELDKAKEALK